MLVISRKSAESVTISPDEDTDLNMTLGELFKDGAIEITVLGSGHNRVKLGISAPEFLNIWRTPTTAASQS